MEDFQHMIDACTTKNGQRDKAILTFLLDTGVRASELISMDIGDIDLKTGAGVIRRGKGGISYAIHVGSRAMRDLRRYLRTRTNLHESAPLFATQYEERLAYAGLRQIIRRRAVAAGVPEPGLHDFRRAFGLQCKRNGMDILTISRLLGHSSVVVTQRYICQDDNDLAEEHKRYSPVDKL